METIPNNNNLNEDADSVEDKVEDFIEDDIKENVDNITGEECYDKYEKLIQLYREELVTLKHTSNDLFEKQLSYISAGALGLSMIVVDKIFKNIGTTTWKELLVISWICFGGTLIVNLISHLHAGNNHNKIIADIDSGNYVQKTAIRRNKEIDYVNYISVAILFIGIFCFVLYTSKNIYVMSNNNNNQVAVPDKGSRGQVNKPQPSNPSTDSAGKSSTPPPPVSKPSKNN